MPRISTRQSVGRHQLFYPSSVSYIILRFLLWKCHSLSTEKCLNVQNLDKIGNILYSDSKFFRMSVTFFFCNFLYAYHPGIHACPGTNGNKVIINLLINQIRRLLHTLIWNINTLLSKGFHMSRLTWLPVKTSTEKGAVPLTSAFVPVKGWKSSQCS